MYCVPKEVFGFDGALQYVDSCPNEPAVGMAFREKHCKAAEEDKIPIRLR